jgi:hypothetical protein
MLEDVASSRFGFWIVALVMAGIDSAFLLKPGSFAFSVSTKNLVWMRVSSNPFTLRNKELASSLLSFPFQLFFISNIDESERSDREMLLALSRMGRLSARVAIFSILAVLTAVLLVLGPCLAFLASSQFSIIALFPLLYAFAILASVLLWQRRRRLGLSNGNVLRISAEIILCPVLLVNIAKRISLAQGSRMNTFRLASLCRAPNQTVAEINENIKYHNGE